jgi:hypothetical protein
MEKTMNEAVRRVLSAAKGLSAVLGGLGSRPPTSPIVSGVRLVCAGGAAA